MAQLDTDNRTGNVEVPLPHTVRIRRTHWRYMLLFAHVPLFLKLQQLYASRDIYFLAVEMVIWMRIAFFLAAALLILPIARHHLAVYGKWLASAMAIFFVLWLAAPFGAGAANGVAILYSMLLGGCAALMLHHFAYTLNNAERFTGAALTSLYYVFFQLVLATGVTPALAARIYIGGLVLGTLISLFTFRPRDIEATKAAAGDGKKAAILIAYLFYAYHVIELFYVHLQELNSIRTYLINGLSGVFIFFTALFLYRRFKFMHWHMLNLFFLGLLLATLFRRSAETTNVALIARFLSGFGQIGFIVVYALLGGALSHFARFRDFKRIQALLFGSIALSYAILGIVLPHLPAETPLVVTVISSILFASFLLLTPLFFRNVFYEASGNAEVQSAVSDLSESQRLPERHVSVNEQLRVLLLEQKLTARETEIVKLLVEGLMYKECAARLGISINTVKFHAANAYEKLGIHGRSQLFSLLNREAPEQASES